ncbi:MAG: type II secretion system F family protein [Candidatus Margulisbacteria bacterium]|nr:type II secretion system F family protein [Candidatus Margulisiibacteriota bacterium]
MNSRQTAAFCSQLKALLAAGLPLLAALKILKCHAQAGRLISEGEQLSRALRGILPDLACGAIGAAEQVGALEDCLARLAAHYEHQAETHEKLIGSLIYPLFVLLLSVGSLFGLIFFILPGMNELFVDLNTPLPALTAGILNVSELLARGWIAWLIASVAVLVIVALMVRRQPLQTERAILRAPVVGRFYRQEQVVQVLGTLGTLLRGGTPIREALQLTADSLRSVVYRQVIGSVGSAVEQGTALGAALGLTGSFPEEAIQLIAVGEGSGQLAEMLASAADFQIKQREFQLKRLTTLLEPALTLAVGGVVALIVVAMFLPLINMISSLQ